MATATAATVGHQQTIIDSASKSSEASMRFMKQITSLVISHIVYQRNFFGEDCFQTDYLLGVCIKTMKPSASPAANSLHQWINSAIEALDRKYLKSFILQIHDAENTPIETYTLQYSFENDEISCNFTTFQGQMELSSNLKQQVVSVLRNIVTLTASGDPFPDGASLVAKIGYQPGTPLDYEPQGFKGHYVSDSSIVRGKYSCGKLTTPYHTMEVNVKYLDKKARNVLCLCGKTDLSSNLLYCGSCGNIQHAPCYKIFAEDDVSQKEHTCFKCLNTEHLSEEYLPGECIFRRATVLCARSKSISMQKIMQALKLDSEHAELCMRRLMREGAVKKSSQPFSSEKIDFLYNVNKSKIINDLKKQYFDC
ncbi:HORMA domain-containing protein 1 [Frankliniella fusca]|uniref:HORMA domain-containing protein 1 n=1 Tax=Frankliniella fusca TaxID=407009 RepID=A0AAE1LMG4_9NEOP|nr:HORMA domain-containing protein 1 [Frankliniella fusca]